MSDDGYVPKDEKELLESLGPTEHERTDSAVPDITWRTLADIDSTAPQDLLLGMYEHGPNLLYAAGGTGKGATLAYAAGELIELGMRPLIYDPENRPKEWARRTSGLGIDRHQIVYVQPHELPAALFGRPLWDVIPRLGQIAKAAGADIVFIDSILAGMNIGEERLKSDARAPYQVVAALDALGIPSVSTGHTSRATPEGDPYGSVSWVNAMRLTWLGTPGEGEGHRVRWRPRKRNERGHIAAVLLRFVYEDNVLIDVERSDDEENTREWLTTALANGARTVEDLAEELGESFDEVTAQTIDRAKTRIRQALTRMKRDKLAAKVSGKRGSPWTLVSQTDVSRIAHA